jgi:hypothetical protein
VDNGSYESLQQDFKICSGGLKGRFEVGSLLWESPLVAAGELYEEEKDRPVDAPEWAQTEAEAWCYNEAGEEIGYIRVNRRWHAAHDNSVFSLVPLMLALNLSLAVLTLLRKEEKLLVSLVECLNSRITAGHAAQA